ncbi:probable splicing factor, arginine/serine-rich 7 [Drosophila sulfurigaster albostrigata]|uniref:Probable splicing factor, arginine/serine-rich 7 n=1 Tax=Drosophila albomicans TaxID=7291 RepID=A0A6P8WP62_DROAB|nr:probable splicing factor, arginine/serine-rich 7 [Drosophila albomicans]XP_062142281.1 probable splicing factor, arginine/serine-rich 7 [Drosophila sulfurigaster albostrigata]
MAGGNTPRVIQVTNIAPQATKDQMQTLFGNIGKIEEIRLYPTIRDVSCPVQSRICYVKYTETSSVPVAQHLTNTVFIDRALIVIPVLAIPEEYRALEMLKNGTIVPGLQKPDSKLPPEVINRIEGQLPQQVIKTYDPKLVEFNLPEYPALPSFYDARKIEEIRRTIIVCDVRNEWRLDDLMECFQRAGEVKYARWAEKDNKTFCMIEFCEQTSVIHALRLQGQEFKGGHLSVYHSTYSITKPEAKSNEAAQAEIEEAMTIVKEAQSMISAAIDPVIGMLAKDKRRRSRSRSRSRERRTSSRSRSHRSSSRRRRRSGSRERRSVSRSRRSRSRGKHSSRSRSKRSRSRHRRSSSRSRRSRSRGGKHSRSSRSRGKRSRSRHRRSNSRSRRSRSHGVGGGSGAGEGRGGGSSGNGKRSRSRERSKKSHRARSPRSRSKRSSPSPPPVSSSSKSRSSRSKDIAPISSSTKSSSSSSSRRRSRTPESSSRKLKAISEDNNESKASSRKSVSVEKSDNMDISNSP